MEIQMSEKQFQVGDVVRLKSGGPSMTVVEIGNVVTGGQRAFCVWFPAMVSTRESRADFPGQALEAEDEVKPLAVNINFTNPD
jgi:uncharacterized protein YodC (DUF2158 family)